MYKLFIWGFIAILSVIMMFLICVIVANLNKLANQQSIAVRRIMRGKGTIVDKYDKIKELISRQRNQLTLKN